VPASSHEQAAPLAGSTGPAILQAATPLAVPIASAVPGGTPAPLFLSNRTFRC
jgi:hypothetical protein